MQPLPTIMTARQSAVMRVFIKRFWGFGPHWPIVSFGKKGSLDALLRDSDPGDIIAFAGTMGAETKIEKERGKLLGLAEFSRKRLSSREALAPEVYEAADKGPGGEIKWPYAVGWTRAWRFTDDPLPVMTEVLEGQLPQSARTVAIEMTARQAGRVLALRREEFDVAFTRAVWDEREQVANLVGPGGTMGPLPSSYVTTLKRDALKDAWTYGVQFGNQSVFKVGWSHDTAARLKELNAHVPHEVIGESWKPRWTQKWASADQAFAMERRILDAFPGEAKWGERVHCTPRQFEAAWMKVRQG